MSNSKAEKRTSHVELPSYQELKDILAYEAKRNIPDEKIDRHYGDFSTIIALLEEFNIPTDFFTKKIKFTDLGSVELFNQVVDMFDQLIENILKLKDKQSKQYLFNNLYDYLSEEDVPEKADLIFVFGSKATFRTERAVNLYKQGYASKILISGKGPFYENDKNNIPEAETLGKFAVEQGVPEEALILETESITVPDNVKRSLNMLEKETIPHKRIILANSPFSQRRGWAHFSKMSDVDTILFRVNTNKVSDRFSRGGWYKNETGTKVIIKEFFGLRASELLNTS